MRSRRSLITLPLLGALLVAGCSSGVEDREESGPTRDVEHARGTTAVPEEPQRVVVLEPVQFDTSVALGVTPVGAAVLSEAEGAPAYLGEEAARAELVGTVPEPNLEEIAALDPDLILGTEERHSDLYDQLTEIAPTVYLQSQADPWQENVGLVAEALGDTAGADELLAGYEERCDEIAEKYGTAGMTAQLVRPRDGILTLYGPTSFAGSTLECAGFTTPERDWEGSISVDVSPELVLEARADLVVVTTPDVDDPSTIPTFLTDAAFPGLRPVDQAFWITGVGPLGGMTVLDDIERLLTSED